MVYPTKLLTKKIQPLKYTTHLGQCIKQSKEIQMICLPKSEGKT